MSQNDPPLVKTMLIPGKSIQCDRPKFTSVMTECTESGTLELAVCISAFPIFPVWDLFRFLRHRLITFNLASPQMLQPARVDRPDDYTTQHQPHQKYLRAT